MRNYNQNLPLISVHIPKCAGTSFYNILNSWFNNNLYKHYFNERWNLAPRKHSLYKGIFKRSIKTGICIHGHFNNARDIGVEDYYPEVNQFITIIRDPFELHLSNYFYIKQLGKNSKVYRAKNTHEILLKNFTLEQYLNNKKKSLIKYFMPREINIDNYQDILNERFVAIGISENLQDSVNLFAKKLNFPRATVCQSNKSLWDEPIPVGAREEFYDNNKLEVLIYEYAKKRLYNDLNQI